MKDETRDLDSEIAILNQMEKEMLAGSELVKDEVIHSTRGGGSCSNKEWQE